ncbi:predicted protein [Streptomyces sviceus ATCC 29083]|uniref:Uncharacterized protein n=1 Tax=Streptomyces sviceus (strain ATCC 29083 / DSM 924 / JCM 4929 / NBRC 13980 / NCIMB 11184 / NRRL 5439 / UC 5370) TaxID=463191 RepID=B5HY94_STRX2|nr:predicted protein [Streptomyces sviceus ATCC 29083]
MRRKGISSSRNRRGAHGGSLRGVMEGGWRHGHRHHPGGVRGPVRRVSRVRREQEAARQAGQGAPRGPVPGAPGQLVGRRLDGCRLLVRVVGRKLRGSQRGPRRRAPRWALLRWRALLRRWVVLWWRVVLRRRGRMRGRQLTRGS